MSQNKPWLSWLLLLFLGITWGTSYILIKKGLVVFSSIQLAALRITLSALAFLPVFIFRFSKINWKKWKYLLVVGLAGSGLPAIFFAFAQKELSSSLTGVLSSMTPLFTLVIGLLFFGLTFKVRQISGILLGLAGTLVLVWFGGSREASGNIWYGLLVVAAASMYALSSNTVKAYLQNMKSLTISSTSFVLIGPLGLAFLLNTDFFQVMENTPGAWTAFGYVLILSLAGTVIASILFFRLVQIRDAVFASMVSYLIPLIALFWGYQDGEQLSWYHFTGMALILTGLYLSRERKRKEIQTT
ncbi:MAG: EamA family transporter [Bacteroidetes bacterium]|nr:EamA family transporter [Bacteroidota bacterium]